MKMLLGGAAALGVLAMVWLGGGGDAPTAKRVGYFKSGDNARVIAYQAAEPLTKAQARAVLLASPATDGSVTMAVLYQPGSTAPGDKLTLAPDLAAAARLIGEPPYNTWAVRMRINPAGAQTFD